MFAVVSFLLVAIGRVHMQARDADCNFVTYEELCNYTFGCSWEASGCEEQGAYGEGVGPCPGEEYPDEFGYDCYYNGVNHFLYDPTYYDSCNGEEYTHNLASCPDYSSEGVPCELFPRYVGDTQKGCYELDCTDAANAALPKCQVDCTDPANANDPACICVNAYATNCPCDKNPWKQGCYLNTHDAGICDEKSISGCGAIPFCHWNSSCKPDWKCYYSYENYIYPAVTNTGSCNTTYTSDGGPGCKFKQIGTEVYCTSDTITVDDEKCIKAGASEDTCTTAGCEWIAPGASYTGWCVQIGSGAYVARMPLIALMVILSIMLTYL